MNYDRANVGRLHGYTARLGALLALVCALSACEQAELTQTVVIIDADSEVRDRTRALSLRAIGVASNESSFTKRVVEPDWPIRLVFRPEDPQARERFRVTADASDAVNGRVAIGTLETNFVRNQARFVRFVLEAGCSNADEVVPIPRDAAKLARSRTDATRVRACDAEPQDGPEAATDGGPPEAGEPDGPPTGMDDDRGDPPDQTPPAAPSGTSGTPPSGGQPEDGGCTPGSDGGTCQAPDACAEPNACRANEACTPAADGGVSCSCTQGFERRGAECVPLRTCAEENGGCEQLCTMQDGRRRCACTPPARLSADGQACRDYGSPERLDRHDMDPGTFEVTMSADGTAFVSWIQNATVWINRHRPAEGWSGALPNDEPVQSHDLLALAPDATGGALVAWTNQGTATSSAQAAHYDGASRRWEVPWRVDDASAGMVDQLGVFGGHGEDFIVGILTDDPRAQTRRITTRRVTVPIVFHDAVTRDLATDAPGGLAFALDSAARGVVAWTHSRTATSLPVQTRYVPESGTIAASAIDAGGSLLGGPRVGLTRAGAPIAVWYESDAMPAQHLIAAVGDPAGTWGAISSSPPVGKITLYAPDVAFAGDGRAMVVWQDRSTVESAVRASLFTPGRGWTDPQRLDPANAQIADWLDVAGDGKGNFFATWTQWRAVTEETYAQDVWASRYVDGVGWEPAALVEHDDIGNMTEVRVAIASAEQAVVVFRRLENGRSNLWASRFD